MIRSGFCTLLVGVLATASVAHADSLNSLEPRWTADVLRTLSIGDPVLFHPAKRSDQGGTLAGAIYIAASQDSVWDVLTDPESHPEYLKSIKSSRIVERSGGRLVVDHTLKMSILPMNIRYRYQVERKAGSRMDFRLLSGDLRAMRGGWRLFDSKALLGKKGTVVFYKIHLDPGGLVPSGVVRGNLKGDLPSMLEKVRGRVYRINGRQGVAMR